MITKQRFDQRVAVVLGGTSGIGLATARRLRGEGAAVVVAARHEPAVSDADGGLVFQQTDIAKREEIDRLFAVVAERFDRLDVVVNCAGVIIVSPTMDVQPRHWQRTMDVNLTGVFHVCQAAIPQLRSTLERGLAEQAAIVNVVSIDAIAGDRGMAAYSAAKAGALNFTRSLAIELAPERIRVNAVSPGAIDTPMAAPATSLAAGREAYRRAIPAGRIGRPEEVAAAIAFLASDEATFVIGSNLVVDGGVTAGTGHPDMLALFTP
ncbi:MAG: 3-oxoacyl-ACP reductase [Ilumatobacteraceae bacterium]|nr:3-oxoacyl-ACP reductase [Ilumatobacteraceae bacterium]